MAKLKLSRAENILRQQESYSEGKEALWTSNTVYDFTLVLACITSALNNVNSLPHGLPDSTHAPYAAAKVIVWKHKLDSISLWLKKSPMAPITLIIKINLPCYMEKNKTKV